MLAMRAIMAAAPLRRKIFTADFLGLGVGVGSTALSVDFCLASLTFSSKEIF